MRLLQLIRHLHSFRSARAIADFPVKGLACNSKEAGPGSVFVAVKGAAADGRGFIGEAFANGAGAVITGYGSGYHGVLRSRASLIEVPDARKALSRLAAEYHGRPAGRMKVIGVTGTNGKTTITYLIEAILKRYRAVPAVIGTVNYRYGGKVFPSKNTTPGPLALHALLRRMLRSGASHTVMEVSSHALDQDRVADIDFSAAVFTNLTQDHLDYHRDFAGYFAAKAKLFSGLPASAAAIVNTDDPYGRRLRSLTRARLVTYAIRRNAAVRAKKISLGVGGSSFILEASGARVRITTPLIGIHNVYNALAAAAWAISEGIPLDVVRGALADFSRVPGRLEKVEGGKGFSVFVDYAHTDDALKNVLTALRQICRGRLIVVFGCGGDRDRTKRPKMGRVAGRLADAAIITNDNPRSEPPEEIIRAIVSGMSGRRYRVIPDRRQAIGAALAQARGGDCVLIAGKGHEDYQITGKVVAKFDDRKVARECLRSKR